MCTWYRFWVASISSLSTELMKMMSYHSRLAAVSESPPTQKVFPPIHSGNGMSPSFWGAHISEIDEKKVHLPWFQLPHCWYIQLVADLLSENLCSHWFIPHSWLPVPCRPIRRTPGELACRVVAPKFMGFKSPGRCDMLKTWYGHLS